MAVPALELEPRSTGAATAEAEPLWQAVDRLVDRAAGLDALRAHRLHLLAARRLRLCGEPVPADLQAEALAAAGIGLLAPLVLAAVREAYNGTMVLLKGPEVCACYPEPSTRPFSDLDILVDDADAAQLALVRAGFREIGDPSLYSDIHHRRPLVHPDLPLPVEIHVAPKWAPRSAPPETQEFLELAVPGRAGVAGVLALSPGAHAIVLAVHSWAHEPLRRALELVDVAAVSACADDEEIAALAREWGVERVWQTTRLAAAALLDGSRLPLPVRLWAPGVVGLRERTVLESHLERWLSGFSELSFGRALAAAPGAIAADFRRDAGDTWASKLRRSGAAFRNATRPRSQHDRIVEELGLKAHGPALRRRK